MVTRDVEISEEETFEEDLHIDEEDELDGSEDSTLEEENGSDETDEPSETPEVEEEIDTDDDGELVVSIGEDTPPQDDEKKAPAWVRELRKSHRELKKQNRELQDKIKSVQSPESEIPVLGKEPDLEDFDYDSDKFKQAYISWTSQKQKVEEHKAKVLEEQQKQEQEWKESLNLYEEKKQKLRVSDYEEAEYVAQDNLSQVQQGMIVKGADDPALVIYALGKNPKKLKELTQIKDPVKFAFAVSKMETQLNIRSKKKPPAPEKTFKSTIAGNAVADNLEKLREDARQTGNWDKVRAYKSKNK